MNNNALDFDDIILLTVRILKENEDIAEKYQARFQYILVDEYQDTNNSQYELIHILAALIFQALLSPGDLNGLRVVQPFDLPLYLFIG